MSDTLQKYLHMFGKLKTDRTGNWTGLTMGRAPHKPFLLLAILDLFAQGLMVTNFIELSAELGELFAGYWGRVMPVERHGNIVLPFFHLRSSGFWHLIPKPGQEEAAQSLGSVSSPGPMRQFYLGAQLDEELYLLIQNPELRAVLRMVLVKTYFSTEAQVAINTQSQVNIKSYQYSQMLLDLAEHKIAEVATYTTEQDTEKLIRDQGFRKAITRIYSQRCAFCGIRVMTADGHSVIEAAHIIPWSISHNDDVHNGMALCKLCHWTFDEGLLGVSGKYQVLVSGELRNSVNTPGHLAMLENRPILGPESEGLLPDVEALGWHRREVLRM